MIEVSADGTTAKGIWIMAGLESGLMDPEVAKDVPPFVFSGGEVDGKPVWAHWVWCKYGVDFIKQDGEWRIWHFRCYEVARAPFNRDWISFAEDNQEQPRLASWPGSATTASRSSCRRSTSPIVDDRH